MDNKFKKKNKSFEKKKITNINKIITPKLDIIIDGINYLGFDKNENFSNFGQFNEPSTEILDLWLLLSNKQNNNNNIVKYKESKLNNCVYENDINDENNENIRGLSDSNIYKINGIYNDEI
jgi:hypothetical protein